MPKKIEFKQNFLLKHLNLILSLLHHHSLPFYSSSFSHPKDWICAAGGHSGLPSSSRSDSQPELQFIPGLCQLHLGAQEISYMANSEQWQRPDSHKAGAERLLSLQVDSDERDFIGTHGLYHLRAQNRWVVQMSFVPKPSKLKSKEKVIVGLGWVRHLVFRKSEKTMQLLPKSFDTSAVAFRWVVNVWGREKELLGKWKTESRMFTQRNSHHGLCVGVRKRTFLTPTKFQRQRWNFFFHICNVNQRQSVRHSQKDKWLKPP